MQTTDRPQQARVGLIDELRGLSILLMVGYHALIQLVYIWGISIPVFHWPFVRVLQQLFAGLFILISGISSQYSKNNLRRGLLLLPCALAITAATYFFTPDMFIAFGVLHFLSIAMILYHLLHPLLCRIPWGWGYAASLLLFVFCYGIDAGYLGLGSFKLWLPDAWYRHYALSPLGLMSYDFSSADYFPLLPWIFVFLAGTFLGIYIKQGRLPAWCYRTRLTLLARIGRHTLMIYMLHMVVIYGVLMLLFTILRGV